ncbi:MAG: extracellular solute-binding protein, partial [Defluviitaleaceae bacterium]|nr:extracellular solute-binding protein [Defluviitaleaceae bacterium]
MKKIIAISLCTVFLFSAACGPNDKKSVGNDDNIGSVIQARPNPLDLPGDYSLEIAVFEDESIFLAVSQMAAMFTEKYPNITVNVTAVSNGSNYAETLKTMILTEGYAPDLIAAPPNDEFMLDPTVISRLTDLYGLLYEDPFFDEGDWFMNALHAFASDGKLYEFPLNVKPVLFSINNTISDDLTSNFKDRSNIAFFELLDVYNQADTSDLMLYNNQSINDVFWFTFNMFFNEYTDAYDFTDPLFLQMFDLIEKFFLTNVQSRPAEIMRHVNAMDDRADAKNFVFQKSPFSAIQYILPFSRGNPQFLGAVPMVDGNGRIILDKQVYPLRLSIHAD